MAWFRTMAMIQAILEEVFKAVVLAYVDNCFWIAIGSSGDPELPTAEWLQGIFRAVVSDLLGWTLVDFKCEVGKELTLLGLKVGLHADSSSWCLDRKKANEWACDLTEHLRINRLLPGEASKLCGRLAFLNTHIFNRVGRALLRPLIWRQMQHVGPYVLTKRLPPCTSLV